MTIPKTINEIQSALANPKPLLFNSLNKRLNIETFFNLYHSVYNWAVEKDEEKPSETAIEKDFLRMLEKAQKDLFINSFVYKKEKYIVFNVNDAKYDITKIPNKQYYKVYNFEDSSLGSFVFVTTLEILFGYNMLKEDNGFYMKKEDIITLCVFFEREFIDY
jgi:hypothetical protein